MARILIGLFSFVAAFLTVFASAIIVGMAQLPKGMGGNGESSIAIDPTFLLHPTWWQLVSAAVLTVGFYWLGNKLLRKRTA
jgi:hypothetical protein